MTEDQHGDPLVDVGVYIGGVVAGVASFSTLRNLALAAAWPEWLSPALPLTVDVLATVAVRVWLNKRFPASTRAYARKIALLTIGGSVLGNVVQHLMSAGYVALAGWVGVAVVVVVGAVPPSTLAAAIHLRSLLTDPVPARRTRKARKAERTAVPESPTRTRPVVPDPVPAAPTRNEPKAENLTPGNGPGDETATDELRLHKARKLYAEHLEQHGRPISRDALRKALRCKAEKASEYLEQIRKEAAA